jgi:Na(+)-translocating NADH:ubiquinone oxidoreductase F subunit
MHYSPSADKISAGIGSSYVFKLQAGDMVKGYGPFGDFHIKDHSEKEMVYIGGGAGMAPLRSHISYLLETKKTQSKVSYWYGARTENDLFYMDYFKKLSQAHDNFDFQVALSNISAKEESSYPRGFIHEVFEHNYLSMHKSIENIDFYLCGPPVMIDSCKKMLSGYGVKEEQILYDEF